MREVILARRIEQELTKDEILELYLNHIYFGHGRYGIEEAARYYFGKSVREVTLAEAAMLAGIVKGPERLLAARRPARARRSGSAFVLDADGAQGLRHARAGRRGEAASRSRSRRRPRRCRSSRPRSSTR